MDSVTVRELRNRGGDVLNRVARGESLLVTRDGSEVAVLSPLPAATPPTVELIARWRRLPPVDHAALRADVDAAVDQTL